MAYAFVTQGDMPHLGGNVHGGDPWSWYPSLWKALVNHYAVSSVLDVGCGEGHAVQHFREACGLAAVGIDGLPLNVQRAVTPIQEWDLLVAPFHVHVDLVWCCEVVEHVEPAFVGNVIQTLANGRIIAMTAAGPKQSGYHHVNCQTSEYWIDRIIPLGYTHDWHTTRHWREVAASDAAEGTNYFHKTGLVFVRGEGV